MQMHDITLSALGNAAIAYATRGFAVFPCAPHGKVPATTHHGCRDATKDLARITAWWCDNPNYNVAVATGPVSKVFVLDVDGIDAEASLRKLEGQHGALPETIESITPRGRHIFLRCENGVVRNSAGAIAPGLDIRGDGGYVVLPPSIHPSGRPYVWSVDSGDHFAAGLAYQLAWRQQ
jgi:hypothetical protein